MVDPTIIVDHGGLCYLCHEHPVAPECDICESCLYDHAPSQAEIVEAMLEDPLLFPRAAMSPSREREIARDDAARAAQFDRYDERMSL